MTSILVAVKGAATQACSPGGSCQSSGVGLLRGLSSCDIVGSGSTSCSSSSRHVRGGGGGGGGSCYGSSASFSSSRQRHPPTVESVAYLDRFKPGKGSSSPSSSNSSDLEISCHLATERESPKNENRSSSFSAAAAAAEFKLLTPKEDENKQQQRSPPPAAAAPPLTRFSHFLRELARQDVWAGLLDPFQGAGEISNDVNYFIQHLKLRSHPLSSTSTPTPTPSSPNLDTATISDMASPPPITESAAGVMEEQSAPQALGHTTSGAAAPPNLFSYATEAAMGTAVGAGSCADVMSSSSGGGGGTLGLSIEPMTFSSTATTELTGRKLVEGSGTGAAAAASVSTVPAEVASTTIGVLPEAEICHRSARCVTAAEIGSVDNLARWLEERIVPSKMRQWGVAPGTKRVSNLWCELVEGEISLEDSVPPKRSTHVSSVKIRDGAGLVLVESHQEMADGRKRPRNRPLSEKMRPGERVEEACLRGIFEELGCELGARERVMMVPMSYRREEEERDSNSYPGLPTRYVIHSMAAHIQHLPAVQFFTEEDESDHGGTAAGLAALNGSNDGSQKKAVGVKRHFWRWVPEHLLGQLCQKR